MFLKQYYLFSGVLVGFCSNSILIRLAGLKSGDDIIYPVIITATAILIIIIDLLTGNKIKNGK